MEGVLRKMKQRVKMKKMIMWIGVLLMENFMQGSLNYRQQGYFYDRKTVQRDDRKSEQATN